MSISQHLWILRTGQTPVFSCACCVKDIWGPLQMPCTAGTIQKFRALPKHEAVKHPQWNTITSISQMDTLRLWLASGQGHFYFCLCLQFTECPGTGHCTKRLPAAGEHFFPTHFQKFSLVLLPPLIETWDWAHRERGTALPVPAMPFWDWQSAGLLLEAWSPGL